MVAQRVIAWRVVQVRALARPRQRVLHHLRDARLRAVGHQQDAVGEQDGLVHVVGDHEGGLAGLGDEAAHLLLQRAAGERVERAERLVHQQQFRRDGEGAGDADALLHAARELRRLALGRLLEPDAAQRRHRRLADARLGPGGVPASQRELDVPARRHPGHQRVALEDHGAVERGAGDLAPAHQHAALVRRVEAGEDVEDLRLAAARVADEADELARIHGEPAILEDGERAEAPRDPLHRDERARDHLAQVAVGHQRLTPATPRRAPRHRAAGRARGRPGRSSGSR